MNMCMPVHTYAYERERERERERESHTDPMDIVWLRKVAVNPI